MRVTDPLPKHQHLKVEDGSSQIEAAAGVREVQAIQEIDAPRAIEAVSLGTPKKRVVVVGGGYGGLEALRMLGGREGLDITLLDRNSDFVFQPLLFQVATGRLAKEDICSPIAERVAKYDNARFVQTGVRDVDEAGKKVTLDDGRQLAFDYLIVAAGAKKAYFGHDKWADVTVGLKSPEDAVKLRNRVTEAFEQAARETDPEKRRALLTFVIVGGGPVGVEMSGELPAVIKRMLKVHPSIDRSEVKMMLIDGGERLLPTYTEKHSKHAARSLAKKGVEVLQGKTVTDIQADKVVLADREIATRNVLWCAGVEATPIAKALDSALDRAGRVMVDEDLTLPGFSNIFVVGDLAHATSEGKAVPGVAQGAIQGARFAAQSILGDMTGQERGVFKYDNPGEMAYIHRGDAIVEMPQVHMSGKAGWGAWLALHAAILPESLRTRAAVLGANLFGSYKHLPR